MQTEYKLTYPCDSTMTETEFLEYINTSMTKLSDGMDVPAKHQNIKSITLLFKLPITGKFNIDEVCYDKLFYRKIHTETCSINFYNNKLISLLVPEMIDDPTISCRVTFENMNRIYGDISMGNISRSVFWKRLFQKTYQQLTQLLPAQGDETADNCSKLVKGLCSMISLEQCNTIFIITEHSLSEDDEEDIDFPF